MAGRRSIRSVANAETVCQMTAEGHTAAQCVRALGYGNPNLLYDWARDDHAFGEMYARAKEVQADRFAEELIEIADDGSNDWMEREIAAGVVVTVPDHEHINRSKLRVDTRKFLMAKMAPRKYGEQQIHKHEGAISLELLITSSLGPQTIEHDPAAPQQIGSAKPAAGDE